MDFLFFLIILIAGSKTAQPTEDSVLHHSNGENKVPRIDLKYFENTSKPTFLDGQKRNKNENNGINSENTGTSNTAELQNSPTSFYAVSDNTLKLSPRENISLDAFNELVSFKIIALTNDSQKQSEQPIQTLIINQSRPFDQKLTSDISKNIDSKENNFSSTAMSLTKKPLLNDYADIPFLNSASEIKLTSEYRLVNDLLSRYNRHIRPVRKANDITHIFVEFSLFKVLEMDTKKQILKTNAELITRWSDSHLIWDPSKYDNISIINIPYTDVWIPDIILYNTASTDYSASTLQTNVIVRFDGEVELVSHTIFSSVCDVDTQWYPFDQQDCEMHFASWTYDSTQIQLTLGPADISDYSENPGFFLENFYAVQQETHNPCCRSYMSAIVYHVQLQRRTKFSLFFYLMPGILINICALMVFSLPVESGEKIALGINSMLAMIVFLMAMTEKLPPTEKIPLAGMYYGICLSIVTLNIAFSVLILNLSVAGDRDKKVPSWLRGVVVCFSKCMWIKLPEELQDEWGLDKENNMEKATIVQAFVEDVDIISASIKNEYKEKNATQQVIENYDDLKDAFQRRAIMALETLSNQCKKDEADQMAEKKKKRLSAQWKFISRVFDRFLFTIFFFGAFLFNVLSLTSSPFKEEFRYCPIGSSGECDDMAREDIIEIAKKMMMEAAVH